MDDSQLPEHLRPRRNTAPPPPRKRGLRDTDTAQSVTVLRASLWGILGAVLGGALGFFLGSPLAMLVLAVLGWGFVTGTTLFLTNAAGSAASTLYAPGSGSPPRKKEYSQAESLVARGLYAEAVTAFELAVAQDPTDPTPYLRIARTYRDHLGRPEDAARWFKRALREAAAPPGLVTLTRKELVELYTHRLGTPEKALPDLARMAEELAGTPDGDWAAAELKAIKERM